MYTNPLILDAFQQFRMAPLPIDEYELKGKMILDDRISSYTGNGKPIKFVMLGYPMKSPNDRDKVLGNIPDLGEELSLGNFKAFNDAIKQVYSPGVEINIVSDGYVFNDVMQVSDSTVRNYNEISMDIARQAPINWFQLTDFYHDLSIDRMRDKVMMQFGITTGELQRRILMDPDVNQLYRGMIRFMDEDLAIYKFNSANHLHKQAKIVAREMMLRNEAYSKMIAHEFKDSIRLSMHPSVNNGNKYSFQLIPSPKAWTSPWHCAIVINDGVYETIHRRDAEAAGYELIFKEGKPHHYVN